MRVTVKAIIDMNKFRQGKEDYITEVKPDNSNCMTCKADNCEFCNGSEYYEKAGE